MSNFLSTVMTYAEPWVVSSRSTLDASDIAAIDHAEVIESKQYEGNKSVAFFLKSGGFKPIPLDKEGQALVAGTILDLNSIECLTLSRGSETCQKIHVK